MHEYMPPGYFNKEKGTKSKSMVAAHKDLQKVFGDLRVECTG